MSCSCIRSAFVIYLLPSDLGGMRVLFGCHWSRGRRTSIHLKFRDGKLDISLRDVERSG